MARVRNNNYYTQIEKTVSFPFVKINNIANQLLSCVGVNDSGTQNLMKASLALTVFNDVVYPVLEPIILKRMPQLAVSYKMAETFKSTLDVVQSAASAGAVVTIASVLSSQSKTKMESDGFKVIIPEIYTTEVATEVPIEKPVYNDYVNKEIDGFKKIITNTTVTNNKSDKKMHSFIFHGPAGTGKSSITHYLADKFKSANIDSKTYHYKLSNANLTDRNGWQLAQIINFINNQPCDYKVLDENFNKSINNNKFKKGTDNICIEFDEIDQLGKEKIANLQSFYDKLIDTKQNILFMGTTNKLDDIPAPIKDRRNPLYIGFPNTAQKEKILVGLCENLTFTKDNKEITTNGLFDKLKETDSWKKIIPDNNPPKISGRAITNTFNDAIKLFSAELAKNDNYIDKDANGLNRIAEIFDEKLDEAINNAPKDDNILGYDKEEETRQSKPNRPSNTQK